MRVISQNSHSFIEICFNVVEINLTISYSLLWKTLWTKRFWIWTSFATHWLRRLDLIERIAVHRPNYIHLVCAPPGMERGYLCLCRHVVYLVLMSKFSNCCSTQNLTSDNFFFNPEDYELTFNLKMHYHQFLYYLINIGLSLLEYILYY